MSGPAPRISLMAVASLLLGIVGVGSGYLAMAWEYPALLLVMLAAIVLAIVAGLTARGRVRRSGGHLKGSGLADLGIVLSVFGVLPLLIPTEGRALSLARRAQATNNLKQIALALNNYHDRHGRFPPAVVYGPDGRPLYSWRVLILPFMEGQDLYKKFKLDESWDSPHNRTLLAERPGVYDPVGIHVDKTLTFTQVFIGPGTAFEGRVGVTRDDFPDGPYQTLLLVEAAEPVLWTKPIDLAYLEGAKLPPLGGVFKDSPRPFDSNNPSRQDGALVAYADGSAEFLRRSELNEPFLRAIITRNGGESVDRKAHRASGRSGAASP